MVRWLSFFSEYDFVVHNNPGSTNIIASPLSRRPEFHPREHIPAHAPSDKDDDNCVVCATLGINATAVVVVNLFALIF